MFTSFGFHYTFSKYFLFYKNAQKDLANYNFLLNIIVFDSYKDTTFFYNLHASLKEE